LVKEGVIHSTDTVIESWGNYDEFFKKMVESEDFTPLSRAHSKNLSNAITSIKEGKSPVIFDNTCLRIREVSPIVEAALELGMDDKNIRIEDVESNLSAEELATRNSHGVPLEKIKTMMETKKSVGVLTVDKIVESIIKKLE
jgi:hypothetical protein